MHLRGAQPILVLIAAGWMGPALDDVALMDEAKFGTAKGMANAADQFTGRVPLMV